MAALATKEELASRLSFVMDADDEREAQGALEDLSEDARRYGSQAWSDPLLVPTSVKNLVLRAAARHMKNYEGYTLSRAGDETVQWTDRGEASGTATFTTDEQRALAAIAGRTSGFGTVGMYAHTQRPAPCKVGYVPTSSGNPFPYYASDTEPW